VKYLWALVGADQGDEVRVEQTRHRSVGFIEQDGDSWACFLVTFQERDGQWRGFFSFRPKDGDEEGELRTAHIFLEHSESEIDRKARSLGRPLLKGLLSSALHLKEVEDARSPKLRRAFRQLLTRNSLELADPAHPENPEDLDPARLRSLYSSYRLDQVTHFIALVSPEDFEEAVDRILAGTSVDFGAKDRIQFAMMVVEFIEARLPLPPFDVWVKDYAAHSDEYAMYTHTLHRAGRLP